MQKLQKFSKNKITQKNCKNCKKIKNNCKKKQKYERLVIKPRQIIDNEKTNCKKKKIQKLQKITENIRN